MAREGGADLRAPPRKRAAETVPRKRRTKKSSPKAGSSDRRELRNAVHASTADKARWELMGNGSCQELCLPCWPKFQDGREPVWAAPGQATPATAPKPDATPPADNGDEAADTTMQQTAPSTTTSQPPRTAPVGRTPSSAELRLEAVRLRILAKQAK